MAEEFSERGDLVAKLRANLDELVEAVRHRSDAQLREPPEPGEWSALQQLEHQLVAEEIWVAMAVKAAFEDEPDLTDLWNKYRNVEERNPFPPPREPRSLDELIEDLRARQQQTLELIDSIPDEAFHRKGRNTGWGDLTVLQMLRSVYRHYRMHIDQIEEREQSFTPRRVT